MATNRIQQNEKARDFTLLDTQDKPVTLSDFEGQKNVYLVFNRGFTWPYCRRHMAQLRQDYPQFVENETEVVAVGPDSPDAFKNFWEQGKIPFIGLADPEHQAAGLYDQEVNLLKLGRVPAQMVINKAGVVRYVHYARSMADIPENDEIIQMIKRINQAEG